MMAPTVRRKGLPKIIGHEALHSTSISTTYKGMNMFWYNWSPPSTRCIRRPTFPQCWVKYNTKIYTWMPPRSTPVLESWLRPVPQPPQFPSHFLILITSSLSLPPWSRHLLPPPATPPSARHTSLRRRAVRQIYRSRHVRSTSSTEAERGIRRPCRATSSPGLGNKDPVMNLNGCSPPSPHYDEHQQYWMRRCSISRAIKAVSSNYQFWMVGVSLYEARVRQFQMVSKLHSTNIP
jgi:hypothetical protein